MPWWPRRGVDDETGRRLPARGFENAARGALGRRPHVLRHGGDRPVVVLHGVLMNGTLWGTVVEGLRHRYRCIVPELP